jgi:hypothetical protein
LDGRVRFTRDDVERWLNEAMRDDHPPPDLAVQTSTEDVLADEAGVQVHWDPFSADRDGTGTDPGCFRFTFDASHVDELADVASAELLNQVARHLAERWSSQVRTLGVLADVHNGGDEEAVPSAPWIPPRAEIHLPGREPIDVIGPGGRLALYWEHGEIRGRVAMRPVVVPPSDSGVVAWRPPTAVLADLAPAFDETAELEARFGYFEASWLEHQRVIIPAFVFAIESRDAGGGRYRSELIARASYRPHSGLDDAVGQSVLL